MVSYIHLYIIHRSAILSVQYTYQYDCPKLYEIIINAAFKWLCHEWKKIQKRKKKKLIFDEKDFFIKNCIKQKILLHVYITLVPKRSYRSHFVDIRHIKVLSLYVMFYGFILHRTFHLYLFLRVIFPPYILVFVVVCSEQSIQWEIMWISTRNRSNTFTQSVTNLHNS